MYRTTRSDVSVPENKQIDRHIPIPPINTGHGRIDYTWFKKMRHVGDSFLADTYQEVMAFRYFCLRKRWRMLYRTEAHGWRVWRIQ